MEIDPFMDKPKDFSFLVKQTSRPFAKFPSKDSIIKIEKVKIYIYS